MILQPLVENAVIHGMSRRAHGGLIDIEVKLGDDCVICVVSDNGPGPESAWVRHEGGAGGTHTALVELRARLALQSARKRRRR